MNQMAAVKTWILILGLAVCGTSAKDAAAGGAMEPGITMYGQVRAEDGSILTAGRLIWTFAPEGVQGATVRLSTDLVPIETGSAEPYSYKIHIPAELACPDLPVGPNRLPVVSTPITYSRWATLNGAFTSFAEDGLATATFGYAEIGSIVRVDLVVGFSRPPDPPSDPSPADQAILVPLNTLFDWADSIQAQTYDIFVWDTSNFKPVTPTASGLAISEFRLPSTLRPDRVFAWQVVAHNTKGSTEGPIWTFRTAFDGDLQVLLDHLLGKRSLTSKEALLLDYNGDGLIDIGDFIRGIRRTPYVLGRGDVLRQWLEELTDGPRSLALSQKTVTIGKAWIANDSRQRVSVPISILPDGDGVAGINLNIRIDPRYAQLAGVRPLSTNPDQHIYYNAPYPDLINVVLFNNPVEVLSTSGPQVLLLDLDVLIPTPVMSSALVLRAAAVCDSAGTAAPEALKQDGALLTYAYWNAMMPVLMPESEFTKGTSNTLACVPLDEGTQYWLEWSTSDLFGSDTQSQTQSSNGFTVTGLNSGAKYYYRVKAYNPTMSYSNWSAPVFSTQDAESPMSRVLKLAADPQASTVTLNCEASDAISGLDIAWLYYRKGSNGVYQKWPFPFASGSVLFDARQAGGIGTYEFYSIALDKVGNIEPPPTRPDLEIVIKKLNYAGAENWRLYP